MLLRRMKKIIRVGVLFTPALATDAERMERMFKKAKINEVMHVIVFPSALLLAYHAYNKPECSDCTVTHNIIHAVEKFAIACDELRILKTSHPAMDVFFNGYIEQFQQRQKKVTVIECE